MFLNPPRYSLRKRTSAVTAPAEELQRESEQRRTAVVTALAGGFRCEAEKRRRRQDEGKTEGDCPTTFPTSRWRSRRRRGKKTGHALGRAWPRQERFEVNRNKLRNEWLWSLDEKEERSSTEDLILAFY
ncbi:hypothetical protein NDU88_002707 [Pleurodeles waltl]|uniref:Uncharacterized protein n=1 Tax=Pleurodeles waltl TaxID=8319 RepID=A0AAV7SBA3_PLEWA|nr:hypothetical protein NDU88_002707 [Pleurodeles waltl]